MRKRKWTNLLFVSILSMSILIGCSGEEQGKDIQEKKESLIVGTSADYEPFEYFDENGEIVGFEVELTKEIGKELGYDITFEHIPFDNLLNELNEGNIDMIAASMTPTEERMEKADFSDIYYMIYTVAVSKKDSGILSIDNISGKKVGAQKGTIQEDKLNELKEELGGIEAIGYESVNDLIEDVKKGTIDVAIVEDLVVLDFTENNFEMFIIEDENASGSAFAFPKNSDLTEKFNEKIKEYKTNGKLEEFISKWFSE